VTKDAEVCAKRWYKEERDDPKYAQPSQAKPTKPDQPRIVARDLEAKIQPVKRYMPLTKEI